VQTKGVTNIRFHCEDLTNNYPINGAYDIAIASLFFHVLQPQDSIDLIQKMAASSGRILIAAICKPANLLQSSILWMDQKKAPHYRNFIAYKNFGYMVGHLGQLHSSNVKIYDTKIPFVKIYKIG